jgi:hypothetical protein
MQSINRIACTSDLRSYVAAQDRAKLACGRGAQFYTRQLLAVRASKLIIREKYTI